MGNIVILDELTINKIAAGEVIERPASVVKELIENSIDAGATSITIEIKNGGIGKIRIIDNGSGMSRDDLEFAFERHATSKIRKADDLEMLKSMGFRGEALASIAAIANVEMVSKMADEQTGNKIVVEAGKILEQEEIGSQNGTTVTVTNLFFNTPVRYKFLKKDYTELGYIEDTVARIALSNPNIAIKLSSENKTIIQTPGDGDLQNVIYIIYGKEIQEGTLDVDYTYEDLKITGAIGKPEIARNNRTYQMFFVNNRYIKDKTLSASVEQAYKGLLQVGKYGFVVLNLEIDPGKIDVNVHPAKLEIRFDDEHKVFKAVYNSIKETLLKGDLVKTVNVSTDIGSAANDAEAASVEESEQIIIPPLQDSPKPKQSGFMGLLKRESVNSGSHALPKEELFIEHSAENSIENLYHQKHPEDGSAAQSEDGDAADAGRFTDMYQKAFGKLFNNKTSEKVYEEKEEESTLKDIGNLSVFEDGEKYSSKPDYKYIGALFSTYIVIEMGESIYIIDQHAAHERIMYEEVKKNFCSSDEKDSQIMLLPDIIELTHKEKI
ncbi:MAG: DNA mismatch repair endonuclease MutL, partial [Firmicutes bacterium]|nr:DNA mismatch repair endonuclease MutL [Bacillota bacterium]